MRSAAHLSTVIKPVTTAIQAAGSAEPAYLLAANFRRPSVNSRHLGKENTLDRTASTENDRISTRRSGESVRLSKSKVAAYEHCPRRLWQQVYRAERGRHDDATLRLFEAGHRIGELARLKYRDGILVAEDHRQVLAAIVRTRLLIDAPMQRPIFEAAFERKRVVVRADVLQPDGCGGWSLIEVKNSASVKPYQLLDAATQAWVLSGNQVRISSVVIRHPERPFRPWTGWTRDVRFVDVDISSEVEQLVTGRQSVVDAAQAVLAGAEPDIRPGSHCVRPFRCEFRDHCGKARNR